MGDPLTYGTQTERGPVAALGAASLMLGALAVAAHLFGVAATIATAELPGIAWGVLRAVAPVLPTVGLVLGVLAVRAPRRRRRWPAVFGLAVNGIYLTFYGLALLIRHVG